MLKHSYTPMDIAFTISGCVKTIPDANRRSRHQVGANCYGSDCLNMQCERLQGSCGRDVLAVGWGVAI